MGAYANLAESNGWQKPAAQSKFRCYIIEIGRVSGFWRAALRITPHFCQLDRLLKDRNRTSAAFSQAFAKLGS
jgi:hypothetical protein